MSVDTSPQQQSSIKWTIIAVVSAFCTYYCMYAFRKPFTVVKFEGSWAGQFHLQTIIVVSQVIGYTLAKFLGTKVCSNLKRKNVFRALVLSIGSAFASLILLGILPNQWAMLPLFWNGLSLGMVWGMVMRPLEGRSNSEFLLATLSCSFIIASGDVKTTAEKVMANETFLNIFGGDLSWAPFVTASFYLIPFLGAAYMLGKVPKPNQQDVALRSERKSMSKVDRALFMRQCLGILIPLAATYFLLTVFRSYRDDFQALLFEEVGVDPTTNKTAFSSAERIVAFVVLVISSSIILIKRNTLALKVCLVVMAIGLTIPLVATYMQQSEIIDGYTWMVVIGIGAYLCYIPMHCIIFERLVALTRSKGNSVFAMMLFDGIGYIGVILLYPLGDIMGDKFGGGSPLPVLTVLAWTLAITGVTTMIWVYRVLPKYQYNPLNSPENLSKSG